MEREKKRTVSVRLITVLVITIAAVMSCGAVVVRAAESTGTQYYLDYFDKQYDGKGNVASYYQHKYSVSTNTPIYGYYYDDGYGTHTLDFYNNMDSNGNFVGHEVKLYCSESILLDGSENVYLARVGRSDYNFGRIGVYYDSSGSLISENSYETNIPIFDSVEDIRTYLATGDDSGRINKTIPSADGWSEENGEFIDFAFDYDSFTASWTDICYNVAGISYLSIFDAFTSDISILENCKIAVTALYSDNSIANIDFTSVSPQITSWQGKSDILSYGTAHLTQLNFYPYYRFTPSAEWRVGVPSYVYFDEYGNMTGIGSGLSESTVWLDDFKLKGVEVSEFLNMQTITWHGCEGENARDLFFVPDTDTVVVAYTFYYDDADNLQMTELGSTTIDKGEYSYDKLDLFEYFESQNVLWNAIIELRPSYKKDGILYMGQGVYIDVLNKTVSEYNTDPESGETTITDVTETNSDEAKTPLPSDTDFFTLLQGYVSMIGQLPDLFKTVFSFMPSFYFSMIAGVAALIFVCRILGR